MRKHIGKLKKIAAYELVKPRVAQLLNRQGLLKLNIGCGTDYKDGWINIDNNSDNNIQKLDLNWDLKYPLPIPENSVDYIFNEHFIEHLTVEESRAALKDMLRVLKPGGVLRIAMPDLADVFDLYSEESWKKRPVIKNHNFQYVQTRAELVNMSFSWWGHRWLYDWEELTRRLKEVGCKRGSYRRCEFGRSSHKDLRGLETRQGSILIAEVTK